MKVGKIIFDQILAQTPKAIVCSWGASKFQVVDANQIAGLSESYSGALIFYTRGYLHRGHVLISLAGNDTYTVTLGRLQKDAILIKKQIKNVYCDSLPEVLDGLIEIENGYRG